MTSLIGPEAMGTISGSFSGSIGERTNMDPRIKPAAPDTAVASNTRKAQEAPEPVLLLDIKKLYTGPPRIA